MDISNIFLYRITHIENIPHILRFGITHRDSPNANPSYRAIGDTSLIDTRRKKRITVNNGLNKDQTIHAGREIILGDYIPFYFGVRMPMLYVIQHGGNFVPAAIPPADIIYVVCRLCDVVDGQHEYYYTDGHATEWFTSAYDASHLNELPDKIDWKAVKERYWGGTDNLLLKARKQAEFLVKHDISPERIWGWVCYNSSSKEKLVNMGIDSDKVKIFPTAYF